MTDYHCNNQLVPATYEASASIYAAGSNWVDISGASSYSGVWPGCGLGIWDDNDPVGTYENRRIISIAGDRVTVNSAWSGSPANEWFFEVTEGSDQNNGIGEGKFDNTDGAFANPWKLEDVAVAGSNLYIKYTTYALYGGGTVHLPYSHLESAAYPHFMRPTVAGTISDPINVEGYLNSPGDRGAKPQLDGASLADCGISGSELVSTYVYRKWTSIEFLNMLNYGIFFNSSTRGTILQDLNIHGIRGGSGETGIHGGLDCHVVGCEVYDIAKFAIYTASYSKVYNNILYDCDDHPLLVAGSDVLVLNNLIYNIVLSKSGIIQSSVNIGHIIGNTLIGKEGASGNIGINLPLVHSQAIVCNNIVARVGKCISCGNSNILRISVNNCVWPTSEQEADKYVNFNTDDGEVFADPEFVSINNPKLGLKPTSPCLAMGYKGQMSNNYIDIGATQKRFPKRVSIIRAA